MRTDNGSGVESSHHIGHGMDTLRTALLLASLFELMLVAVNDPDRLNYPLRLVRSSQRNLVEKQ